MHVFGFNLMLFRKLSFSITPDPIVMQNVECSKDYRT